MKFKNILSIIILLSSLHTSAQSSSLLKKTLDKPTWLKSVKLSLMPEFQSNFFHLDKNLFSNFKEFKDELSVGFLNLSLSSKAVFKPSSRYILINNFNIDGRLFHANFTQTQEDIVKPTFSISNSLIGVIPVNNKQQAGHIFTTGFYDDIAYEAIYINDNTSELGLLDKDRFEHKLNLFYQYKFNSFLKTRLETSFKLTDHTSDYSNYNSVKGEENDHIKRSASFINSFSLNKKIKLDIALRYNKSLYRNRSALNSKGGFFTEENGSSTARDQLENLLLVPKFTFLTDWGKLLVSHTFLSQKDLNYDGRTYVGADTYISYVLGSKSKKHQLSLNYQFINLKYKTAKEALDDTKLRNDKISNYSIGYKINKILNTQLNFHSKLAFTENKEGFFGGQFDNQSYKIGLNYNF